MVPDRIFALLPLRRVYCCPWQFGLYQSVTNQLPISSSSSSSSSTVISTSCYRLSQVALHNSQGITSNWYRTITSKSSSDHTSATNSSAGRENNGVETERKPSNHELFEKQLFELKLEREALYGFTEDEHANRLSVAKEFNHDNSVDRNHHNEQRLDCFLQHNVPNTKVISTNTTKEQAMLEDQLLEMKLEREALFGFTEEERDNWSTLLRKTAMMKPNEAVERTGEPQTDVWKQRHAEGAHNNNKSSSSTLPATHQVPYHHPFTHLDARGNSVNMVDVGSKVPTQRNAKARTKVLLPPEVMVAFTISEGGDLVGPKGPIFSTAKLAGIMASKRTYELIPLCHAVSLDKCHIDITLHTNEIIIECECSVTNHKTGVEMEALVGASVAALTIYDMVKAVSHRVRIHSTELLQKTGGKRDFVSTHNDD